MSSNLVSEPTVSEERAVRNNPAGAAAIIKRQQAEIDQLRRELWVIAEAIFQNVSRDEAKHWARGIKVSLSGPADAPPKFTVETPAKRPLNAQQLLQDYYASHGEKLGSWQRVALDDFAIWVDDARPALETTAPQPCEHGVPRFVIHECVECRRAKHSALKAEGNADGR